MTNPTLYVAKGKTFEAKGALKAAGFAWNDLVDGHWASDEAPAIQINGVEFVEIAPLTEEQINLIVCYEMSSYPSLRSDYNAAVQKMVAGEQPEGRTVTAARFQELSCWMAKHRAYIANGKWEAGDMSWYE